MRRRTHEFGLLLMLVAMSACSHTQPYYRPGDAPLALRPPDHDDVTWCLFLIGDAGGDELSAAALVAEAAQKRLESIAARRQKCIVIFLGDNVYTYGLPPAKKDPHDHYRQRLRRQIDLILAGRRPGYFTPGNHDWGHGRGHGDDRVDEQEKYINDQARGGAQLLPSARTDDLLHAEQIDDRLRLVFIDTQRWLEQDVRSEEIEAELEQAIKPDNPAQVVIVVAHHPLATHGPHGGHFDWRDYLFPGLQLADWLWVPVPMIYPALRTMIWSRHQDLSAPRNRRMVERLRWVLQRHRPLVYAAGHEHSLQVLTAQRGPQFVLVSGAGSKNTPVWHGRDTLFAAERYGFMELDIIDCRGVFLRVWVADDRGQPRLVYSRWLEEPGWTLQ